MCVSWETRCDGHMDCPNNIDEEGCPCSSREFGCSDGTCVPEVMADLIVQTAPMNKIVCVMQASSGAGVVSV